MKISGTQADRIAAKPDARFRCFLYYGPDRGLVRERAAKTVSALSENPDDPFATTELSAAEVAKDGAALRDALAAQSLMGGSPIVRIRDAGDAVAGHIEEVLAEGTPGVAVLEAGELPTRSKLRKVCEAADNAASVGCYLDDPGARAALAKAQLAEEGVSIAPDALAYLVEILGADRGTTRNEVEKLALFKGDGEISLEDVRAVVDDSAASSIDDLIYGAFDGNGPGVVGALARVLQEGGSVVGVLRTAQNHVQKLHLTRARMEGGASLERAVAQLKPPVFFTRRAAFSAQARKWDGALLAMAMRQLLEAEIDAKSTGMPADEICERTFLRLAAFAARR